MWEIFVPMLVLLARKRRRRRRPGRNRRGFQAIPFQHSLALGALADNTVIKGTILTLGEDLFVISADAVFTLRNQTAGENPIEVGFCHGDLTVGEVEEALQAEVTDPDDIIAKERARRPVRRYGVFSVGSEVDQVLNNGVAIRRPWKFSIGDGHTISFWAVNRSGAVLTVGATVEVQGTIYGRWQR